MEFLIRRLARVIAFVSMAAVPAHAQPAPEPAVKAAFLYKFVGYVEWPDAAFTGPDAPFVIGVAGAEEVAAELERAVQGRTILERRLVVRRLRAGEGIRGVHVLFVGRSEPGSRALLRLAQQTATLAVTESEGALEMGAAINFVTIEDRVGFEVSLESAERAGLRISSRMLAVARRVLPRAKTSAFETELAFLDQGRGSAAYHWANAFQAGLS